jgi:hypothetical protein
MNKTSVTWLSFVLTLSVIWMSVGSFVPSPVQAESPFNLLLPFRSSIDADPQKSYVLTPQNGPWMILATSFAGADAQQRADRLVLELRKQYKLKAFTHRQSYDFTEPVAGRGVNEYGRTKMMKHRKSVKFDEVAVLVGEYSSVEDGALQRELKQLKYMMPNAFRNPNGKGGDGGFSQLAQIRELYQRESSRLTGALKKGPLGSAFATRNPMIPKEFFAPSGLDQFVIDMNDGVKHSLLGNKGVYTVRVAAFRGETKLGNRDSSLGSNGHSKLALAADKAHRLTEALREQGIEAYEFHDRHESIVTVGSFASVGEPRADGKIEINPTVHRIMEAFGASRKNLSGVTGLQPRQLAGISFDVQPVPVKVPRKSIGSDYAAGNSRFR